MVQKQIVTAIKLFIVTLFGAGLVVGASPIFAKVDCAILPDSVCNAPNEDGVLKDSGIWQLLKFVIRILTIGIGVVAVAALTYAGFLYTSAQENAEQTKKAKGMILNTVIGLIAYALMWALLQYLIPGGVFS